MDTLEKIAGPFAGIADVLAGQNNATFSWLILASIFGPMLAGLLIMIGGKISESFTRNFALIGFFFPALAAVWIWMAFGVQEVIGAPSAYRFTAVYDLGLQNSLGIALRIGLNGISLPLYMLASIVGFAAGIYACFGKAGRIRHYLALLLIMHGGIMGIFATTDIFFFYLFHEIALIPTFIMIAQWGGVGRRMAAIEMAVYLTLGAMLSLFGLIMLYMQLGLESFDFATLIEAVQSGKVTMDALAQDNIFALLMFGFGVLVSLWPLHSWAPKTYASAPTSVTMLHAGVLKKFGLYGLLQIAAPLLPEGASTWTPILAVLALGNILIIGFVTMGQKDLKQMLGYSSVMHMGYAFLGIASLSAMGVAGAVMMMFAHGLSVALLFLLATCIYHRSRTFDMREMGGLAKHTPVLCCLFVAGTLASVGVPGFANFWGELAIFVSVWSISPLTAAAAILGIIISAVYGLRAVANIFYGPPSERLAKEIESEPVEDLQVGERVPAAILLTTLLVVGIWPSSISQHVNVAAQRYFEPIHATSHAEHHASAHDELEATVPTTAMKTP